MNKINDSFKKGILPFAIGIIVRIIQILVGFTILSLWKRKMFVYGIKVLTIPFPNRDILIEFSLYITFFVIVWGVLRGAKWLKKFLLLEMVLVIIFHILRIVVFFYRGGFFSDAITDIGLLCLFILSAYICFRRDRSDRIVGS